MLYYLKEKTWDPTLIKNKQHVPIAEYQGKCRCTASVNNLIFDEVLPKRDALFRTELDLHTFETMVQFLNKSFSIQFLPVLDQEYPFLKAFGYIHIDHLYDGDFFMVIAVYPGMPVRHIVYTMMHEFGHAMHFVYAKHFDVDLETGLNALACYWPAIAEASDISLAIAEYLLNVKELQIAVV